MERIKSLDFAVALCRLFCGIALIGPAFGAGPAEAPLDVGSRRELMVDHWLIDRLDAARLVLGRPRDEGIVLEFDKPWEGAFCGYCTVLKDGDRFRMYYRGIPRAGRDGSPAEVTCYAESKDGIHWVKPELGLLEIAGSKKNNVLLAGMAPLSHNFCPLIDTRPGVPAAERYKALAGTDASGLVACVSADGLQWRKLQEQGVITEGAFDSQNVAFWSEAEQCYVCYFRTWTGNFRRISRTTSKDFRHWSRPLLMEYRRAGGEAPIEHLYTNQTQPYFRAPHLYLATAARFVPDRQAITAGEARAIGADPGYTHDVSEAVLLTSRGGTWYDRTFLEGFVRPGIGPENWVSRTNYPVLNLVQTGPAEMSLYVNQNYAQPTAHVRRYSLRLDGLASLWTPYQGGEMVTKPFTFAGRRLAVNYATSAAGSIRVEIQDAAGRPVPGFALGDAKELFGNQLERVVSWTGGDDVGRLAGKPIRLRFAMRDADLYSLKFGP